ncbi:hypothetical protein KGQ71_03425, partial [Patescibacteria group bacterium]|nr:hypothetical protein [Patescibacteria group bacterium]
RNQKCPKIDDPDQEILGMIYPLLEEAVYTGNILDLTDEGMSALAYLVNNLAKVARGKLGRNGGFNQEKFRKLHEGIGQFMNEWNRNIPRPKNKIAVQNFWWAFRHINGHLESNLNMGIAYVIKDLLIALSQLQHTELKQKDALIQQMLVGTGQNERRGASLHNFLPGQSGSARYRLMHFFPEEMPYAAVAILFLRFSTENAALAV